MFFLACHTLSLAAALFSKEFMSSQTWVVLDKLSDSESLKERIETGMDSSPYVAVTSKVSPGIRLQP